MKPILTLPCKNKHSDMEKREEGFHCKSCDHVLTDFRNSSEEEIQTTFQSNKGKICGVFNATQFDYKVSQIQIPAFRAVGLSLLGILGFLGPVITSCESENTATEHKQNAFNLLKFPMHLKGSIRDENTNEILTNFPIQLLQHNKVIKQTITDADGNFDFLVNEKDLDEEKFKFVIGNSNPDTIAENILKFRNKQVRLRIQAKPKNCELGKTASNTVGFVPPVIVERSNTTQDEPMMQQIDGMISYPEPPCKPVSMASEDDQLVVGVIAESQPEFPGGREALVKYLKDNLNYPTEALKNGIAGKVYLRFLIEEDGTISSVGVKKGITECPECGTEAVRVVKEMPKWNPSEIDGKYISTWYTLPIVFKP